MSKEVAPAFQHYPRDMMSDINYQMMNWPERGMYRHLIDLCWLEKSIPSDIESLARILQVDVLSFEEAWKIIGKCFIADACDCHKLLHPRLEKERKKQADYAANKSLAGSIGAKSRWSKSKKNKGKIASAFFANGKTITDDSSASASSSSNNNNIYISVTLKNGTEHPITEEQVNFWKETYPLVDVPETLKRIKSYFIAKPEKRKTPRGIVGCIDSWIARNNDNEKNKALLSKLTGTFGELK